MGNKELLIELCDDLQKRLNIRLKASIHKVKLISELKPENYYLSMTHIGTTNTLLNNPKNAWFVEIHIDSQCIFRESHIPDETECLKEVENYLINKMLKNVFSFGIMSSKKIIDERNKINK